MKVYTLMAAAAMVYVCRYVVCYLTRGAVGLVAGCIARHHFFENH